MNTLNSKVSEIKKSILYLKQISAKSQSNEFFLTAAIVCCGFIATTVSLMWLPELVSISLLFIFCLILIVNKLHHLKIEKVKFDNINNSIEEIAKKIDVLEDGIETERNDYENRLSHLPLDSILEEKEKQINELKAALDNATDRITSLTNATSTVNNQEPYKYGGYTNHFLEVIQRLDFEVDDFGEECASYLRKQFTRALGTCGLRFLNYSKEDKEFFNTETTPAIDKVDCTRRAIVKDDKSEVIIYGRAFIPTQNLS